MDTVTALFGWIGRTLRWVFDLASMAVGVAPTGAGLAEAATVHVEAVGPDRTSPIRSTGPDLFEQSRAEREFLGLWN